MWIELLLFGFFWWMGLYLLRRSGQEHALRWVAAGLLAYALILALGVVAHTAAPDHDNVQAIMRWQIPLLLAPIICWLGTLWTLRGRLQTAVKQIGRDRSAVSNAAGLMLMVTIFFFLSVGALLLPFDWVPRRWLIAALSFDFCLFGVAVGWLDAFEQGEAWRPDFVRSLIAAELISSLFGFQIAIVIFFNGATLALILLLLGTTATALCVQVFADQFQALFDQLIFGRFPQLQAERAHLRDLADALPRASTLVAQRPQWDEATFAKLTRQALSQLDNLPKLATNPLIDLPIVQTRLLEKGSETHMMAKSAELKALLTEAIYQLKPHTERDFDTTSQWRHFNALYYPYVRGIRPHRRQTDTHTLSPTDHLALQWLQTDVPLRTLYNWQKAAAGLIAARLWEQLPPSSFVQAETEDVRMVLSAD